MMSNNRVWDTDPNVPMEIINLNQTAMHSENPLKSSIHVKSSVFGSGIDFLSSDNLHMMLLEGKQVEEGPNYNKDLKLQNGSVLQPRENGVFESGCGFQPSNETSHFYIPQSSEIIPLSGVQTLSNQSHELDPNDKAEPVLMDFQVPIYTAQTWSRYLEDLNLLEYRVETQNFSLEREVYSQYIDGKIISGNREALESLTRDLESGKLKFGTHGVITNPRFDFLVNPKQAVEKQKVLGRGGNGMVELCCYEDIEFVTKTIFRDFRKNEVLFTNWLSNEFIVKSHGLIVRNGIPQMIMDYAGENLLKYGLSKSVPENEIWDITYQLLEALSYLHSNQIRHFDVKPENIVLKEDQNGHKTLKLADFGGATRFDEEVDCMSWTPAYMSPEMDQLYVMKQFPNQKMFKTTCGEITEKCDVYSLALSILFLYLRGHALIKYVTKGDHSIVGQERADIVSIQIVISNAKNPGIGETLIPENVGTQMKNILAGMLKGNVEDRFTADQAMARMKELSIKENVPASFRNPQKALQQKLNSTEKKEMISQQVQTIAKTKNPKIIVVKMKPEGRRVHPCRNEKTCTVTHNYHTLETEEHQRPLKDLNIDLQLHIMQEQEENEKDETLRQLIKEENQPLLKRLVKRKLVNKLNEGKAFKMTRMMEGLESESSNSGDLKRRSEVGNQKVATTTPEPVLQEPIISGPGNLPNFEILDF